jgi:patatin-like phospholipase/acyl hydrolase
MSLQNHLSANGPKRILALDGGGIRGALTLGYLQKIEDTLRAVHGNKSDFRLSQYFDLIGGTSTGSIIAACLAIGMTVEDIKKMYFDLGGKIFAKKNKWWNIFKFKDVIRAGYDAGPLEEALQKAFKNEDGSDILLGGDALGTGLCIIAKRADTNSVWPLINHPDGKYYDSAEGKNKNIPLWKAVRASAAAPSYFLPQVIEVGGGLSTASFVDGGVSMANNPALQLILVATLKGFPFRWQSGADKILLVSVGTGMSRFNRQPKEITGNNLLDWAKQLPDMFMQDASWHNQLILQWLSKSPTAFEIDGEIGNLKDDLPDGFTNGKGLFSYLRYNTWMDEKTLHNLTGETYTAEQVDNLVEMSNAGNRFKLYDIGVKAAASEIKEEHFKGFITVSG